MAKRAVADSEFSGPIVEEAAALIARLDGNRRTPNSEQLLRPAASANSATLVRAPVVNANLSSDTLLRAATDQVPSQANTDADIDQ